MKTYRKTLDRALPSPLIEVDSNYSDCIEMCNSDGINIPALCDAIKAQAKHGSLGESLKWLFRVETECGECLMMKECKNDSGWIKSYSAVYWYICGFCDRDFLSAISEPSHHAK